MTRTRLAPLLVLAYVFLVLGIVTFQRLPDRPDHFALAEAFLAGRLWIDDPSLVGAWDTVTLNGRTYLPFGPLPAVLLVPLVALLGAPEATRLEPIVNTLVGAANAALCWIVVRRFAGGAADRAIWLVALFTFGTVHMYLVLRGGVWHMSQLLAAFFLLWATVESTGRARPVLVGLLGGAAFLSRAASGVVIPILGWLTAERVAGGYPRPAERHRRRVLAAAAVMVSALPAMLVTLLYNSARFGRPLESGYGIAALPPFLHALRDQGLFSVAHLWMNLDLLLWHLPIPAPWPYLVQPDGLGLSVLLTSPGLLLALKADRADPFVRIAGLGALTAIVPALFYYGGGWYQPGYRYLVDALPFLMVLAASGARDGLGRGWKLAILASILVTTWSIGVLWGGVRPLG